MKLLMLVTGLLVLFLSVSAFADDCTLIRHQIKSLPESGGDIFIPAGTYNCSAPIIIDRNKVHLKGAGEGKTIIRLVDHIHAPLLIIGSPITLKDASGNYVTPHRVEDVSVSDFTFDGNRQNHDPTKECGENICDGDSNAVRNNGITVRGASRISIEKVTTHSMISGGLVTEKYCDHLSVRNFTSYDNYFDGFAGYETEDSEFTHLYLHNNRGAGISIDINFNHNAIRNSKIYDNKDVGIFARHVRGNRFINVNVFRSGNHGVFLAQSAAPDSCAYNNEFDNMQIKFSKRSAFRINDDCPGNRVFGPTNLCANYEGSVSEFRPGSLILGKDVLCRP